MEAGNPLLDDYVLEAAGAERPKVCFIPTASGDADHYVVRFYRRFSPVADTSHVSLFRRDKGGGYAGRDKRLDAGAHAGEPPPADHPLTKLPNVTLSAHSAFRTPEASENLMSAAWVHCRRIAK